MFRRTDDPDAEPTDDDQVARNVSPFTVDPGKFTYRLVRGELEFPDYGQVFAHCRIDRGPWLVVPFTLLPPPEHRVFAARRPGDHGTAIHGAQLSRRRAPSSADVQPRRSP